MRQRTYDVAKNPRRLIASVIDGLPLSEVRRTRTRASVRFERLLQQVRADVLINGCSAVAADAPSKVNTRPSTADERAGLGDRRRANQIMLSGFAIDAAARTTIDAPRPTCIYTRDETTATIFAAQMRLQD